MRYADIICEGRDAPLYHFMGSAKACYVFLTDSMPGKWSHDLPDNERRVSGNSFTRDANLKWSADYGVRITVDQSRLATRHQIIPVNANYVHAYTRGRFGYEKENSRTAKVNASEEFVVGDIKPLHTCLTGIAFFKASGSEHSAALVDIVRAYGQKWDVAVTISPDVLAWLKKAFPRYPIHPQVTDAFPGYKRRSRAPKPGPSPAPAG